MQTWWTMITTATLGHHTVLWSSLSIFWRDTQVYWSPRPARAKKIDIPIDGRHVVAMPTWQLRIPCKLRGVFRISGRCCRTSTTANWAGTCIRHIAKWLIIPTQLTLIASVCTHTIWPFSLASWGSLWLKRMLAFCCTGKSRQKVWINPLEWQPSMQWLLASRCRNRRVSPLLGFVWFDPEAGSAMALTAIRANAVHQRREEHVWNRCRMVPVNPRTDMTWTYMDIWYMYVQNCANTLEFTVTVMQICFRNHLRVRCFRGGGRAAQEMRGSGKAIALKKNPHRERHHAMYCNVMFIWFSHRYSFTLKLQSEWTLLLELVRNLKGQKRKKHIHGKSGFSRFFSETNMMNTSSITADSRLEMHHPMRKNYMLICLCCQGSSPDSGPKALLSDTETPACSVTITNSCCLAAKCCGCLTVLCQRGFFIFHRRIWGFNQTTGGNGLSMVWAAAKNMFCSDSCAEVLHAVQDFLCFLLHGNRNNNTGIDFEGGLNDLTLPMKHQKSTCPIRFNPTQFCWSARAAPAVLRFAGMAPGVQIPHPLVCLAMTTDQLLVLTRMISQTS